MSKITSIWGLGLPVLFIVALTASSSVVNSQVDTPINGVPSLSVQKSAEDILLRRMTRPNETLFETETKQLFARFLVDLAIQNNNTQNHSLYADQPINNYRQDEEQQENTEDLQFAQENVISQTQNQEIVQNQQFNQQQFPIEQTQTQQFPQQQQINQNQQFFPQQQQINQNQQLLPQQQIDQNQQFQQAQVNPNQQFQQQPIQNQQFQQQQQPIQNQQFQQQVNPNQPINQNQFPQNQQIGQNQFPQNQQFPTNQQWALVTKPPETFEEVDKLIQQIFRLNVTGILDQSLYLTGSNPVRNLLGGVLKLVFCDPISRLLGRCKGNNTVNRSLNRK